MGSSRPHISQASRELLALARLAMAERPAPSEAEMVRMMLPAAQGFYGDDSPRLRMSFGSVCPRRLWLLRNDPAPGTEVEWETRMKWALGHAFEQLLLLTLRTYLEKQGKDCPWRLDSRGVQKTLTMVVDGEVIEGHTDALVTWNGEPYAIADSKNTTAYSWKRWVDGRMPDEVWGYREQAANYTFSAEREFLATMAGFIWLVGISGFNGYEGLESGWMDRHELIPYGAQADDYFRMALNARKIPLPVHPNRDDVPCRSAKGKAYCDQIEKCMKHP